jgi:hypothetical protein
MIVCSFPTKSLIIPWFLLCFPWLLTATARDSMDKLHPSCLTETSLGNLCNLCIYKLSISLFASPPLPFNPLPKARRGVRGARCRVASAQRDTSRSADFHPLQWVRRAPPRAKREWDEWDSGIRFVQWCVYIYIYTYIYILTLAGTMLSSSFRGMFYLLIY